MPSSKTFLRFLALGALLMWGAVAQAQGPWTPPDPSDQEKDWIKLPAGEWLGGEIKFMRNEDIEFESDKLDVVKLEWVDIVELRSPRILTYSFTEKRIAVGTAAMKDGIIKVLEDGEVHEFRRQELLSIIEGKGREIDFWSGKLSAGFVSRSGNTDQVDYNALGSLRRDGALIRLDLRYTGNFGKLAGFENINNHLGSARVDAFLSRYVFITPLALEFYSDRFQNIDLRTSISAGVGFYLVKRSKLEWFIQLGGGYLSTRYRSVSPGESIQDDTGSLIPVTSFEWDVTPDVELDVDYNANLSVQDVEKLFHHFVALLTIENLKFVDLTTSVTWDHVADPKPRENGSVPKKDDLRTAFGVGIDF